MSACDAAPERRKAAEFFLLQAVRSSQEAAEVAGFLGASSVDMLAWVQDRFGGDPEMVAAARTRAAGWRTGRKLCAADRRRAAAWQSQHPSAGRERDLFDAWSAQPGPGGSAGSEREAVRLAERESTELQRRARGVRWGRTLLSTRPGLSTPFPVRRGPGRDRRLRHRAEAERPSLAAFVSVEHAAAGLECAPLDRVGAALESGEETFAELAGECRALQQAAGPCADFSRGPV